MRAQLWTLSESETFNKCGLSRTTSKGEQKWTYLVMNQPLKTLWNSPKH
jgi:hypothetical protein